MQKPNGAKIGQISWSLKELKSSMSSQTRGNDSSDEELVEFRYYSGQKPHTILAKSVSLKLIRAFSLKTNGARNSHEDEFITFKINGFL